MPKTSTVFSLQHDYKYFIRFYLIPKGKLKAKRTAIIKTIVKNRKTGNPRANGAKRRSGRKPGARVTNFVVAEFKVVARDR